MQTGDHVSPFEANRRETEGGTEYWNARDLYKLLGYSTWQKFQTALEQAKKACENSGQVVSDHFNLEVKMIKAGKGAQSIQQLQREEQKRLEAGSQPSLFEESSESDRSGD